MSLPCEGSECRRTRIQRVATETLAVSDDVALEPDFSVFALLPAGLAGAVLVTLTLLAPLGVAGFLLGCPSVTTSFCPACT